MPKTRKDHPLEAPWVYRGFLSAGWFACYAEDQSFRKSLEWFYASHRSLIKVHAHYRDWDPIPRQAFFDNRALDDHSIAEPTPVMQYEKAIRHFAKRWKLHLVRHGAGYEVIHLWCVNHLRRPALYPSSTFYTGNIPFGGGTEFIWPEVRIEITTMWPFEEESQSAAYDRILETCKGQINDALDGLRMRALNAGFVAPPVQQTQKAKYLRWLYLHVVKGKNPVQIAESECVSHEDMVRQRITECRKDLALLDDDQ